MDLTSRVGFGLFGTGLAGDVIPDEAADISKINDNFRKLDSIIGWILVTSTTHPPNPFRGLGILETDTGRAYIHDGATYIFAFDTNLANGLRGTTAQRDAYWGKPTTGSTTPEITARVALASKGPLWFNTDLGYEERYFAKVGDTGALSGEVALNPGWFPSGAGVKPKQGFHAATSTYGVGTSIISTQPNVADIFKKGVGFVDPPLNGTGSGVRFVIPVEGNYRLDAYGNFNSNTINLMLKQNSVSADATGAFVGDSGSGVNGNNFRSLSTIGSFSLNDFVILAWYASLSGTVTNLRWSIEWDSVRSS